MASSLWAEAVNKGRKEGRTQGRERGRKEGRIEGAREFCLELAKQHHPEVADRGVPLIEACSNVKRLHEWALQAHQLSDSAFLNLLTERSESAFRPAGRRRTPQPSRKAKPKRSK